MFPATGHRATFIDTANGNVYSRVLATEPQAVQYQETAAAHETIAPLGITPEPDWTQYEGGPAVADAIKTARANVLAELAAAWEDNRTGYPYVTEATAYQVKRWARITETTEPSLDSKTLVGEFVDAATAS